MKASRRTQALGTTVCTPFNHPAAPIFFVLTQLVSLPSRIHSRQGQPRRTQRQTGDWRQGPHFSQGSHGQPCTQQSSQGRSEINPTNPLSKPTPIDGRLEWAERRLSQLLTRTARLERAFFYGKTTTRAWDPCVRASVRARVLARLHASSPPPLAMVKREYR